MKKYKRVAKKTSVRTTHNRKQILMIKKKINEQTYMGKHL